MLSELEASDLKPTIRIVYVELFKTMDEGLTLTNRAQAEAMIWRTIDDEELDSLVDFTLENARHVPVVAGAVRATAEFWKRFGIAAIITPRIIESFQFYGANGFDPFGLFTPFQQPFQVFKGGQAS